MKEIGTVPDNEDLKTRRPESFCQDEPNLAGPHAGTNGTRFCQNEPIHNRGGIAALCSTNMPVAGTNSESDIESDAPPHDKTGTFGNGGHGAILP